MADIVLLNQDGVSMTFPGVTGVNMLTADGANQPFYDLTKLNWYLAHPTDTSGRYQIMGGGAMGGSGQLVTRCGKYGIVVNFSTYWLEQMGFLDDESGTYAAYIFFTNKELTIGSTYSSDYILGVE